MLKCCVPFLLSDPNPSRHDWETPHMLSILHSKYYITRGTYWSQPQHSLEAELSAELKPPCPAEWKNLTCTIPPAEVHNPQTTTTLRTNIGLCFPLAWTWVTGAPIWRQALRGAWWRGPAGQAETHGAQRGKMSVPSYGLISHESGKGVRAKVAGFLPKAETLVVRSSAAKASSNDLECQFSSGEGAWISLREVDLTGGAQLRGALQILAK